MATKYNTHGAPSRPDQSADKAIKEGITEVINQDRVVIFSKPTCPYCDDAKKVFEKMGQTYSAVELTDHPNPKEMQTVLKEMTGASTVPRVFVDGVCIGGGSDTVKLYENGELDKILKQPGSDGFSYTDENNNPTSYNYAVVENNNNTGYGYSVSYGGNRSRHM